MQGVDEFAFDVEERNPRDAHQVLEAARREEVDTAFLDVNRHRTQHLICVGEHQCAGAVRTLDNGADVLNETVHVVAATCGHQRRVADYVFVVVCEIDHSVAHRHPRHFCSATLLCQPDVACGGKLHLTREIGRAHV